MISIKKTTISLLISIFIAGLIIVDVPAFAQAEAIVSELWEGLWSPRANISTKAPSGGRTKVSKDTERPEDGISYQVINKDGRILREIHKDAKGNITRLKTNSSWTDPSGQKFYKSVETEIFDDGLVVKTIKYQPEHIVNGEKLTEVSQYLVKGKVYSQKKVYPDGVVKEGYYKNGKLVSLIGYDRNPADPDVETMQALSGDAVKDLMKGKDFDAFNKREFSGCLYINGKISIASKSAVDFIKRKGSTKSKSHSIGSIKLLPDGYCCSCSLNAKPLSIDFKGKTYYMHGFGSNLEKAVKDALLGAGRIMSSNIKSEIRKYDQVKVNFSKKKAISKEFSAREIVGESNAVICNYRIRKGPIQGSAQVDVGDIPTGYYYVELEVVPGILKQCEKDIADSKPKRVPPGPPGDITVGGEGGILALPNGRTVTATISREKGEATKKTGEGGLLALPDGRTISATVIREKGKTGKPSGEGGLLALPDGRTIRATVSREKGKTAEKTSEEGLLTLPDGRTISATITREKGKKTDTLDKAQKASDAAGCGSSPWQNTHVPGTACPFFAHIKSGGVPARSDTLPTAAPVAIALPETARKIELRVSGSVGHPGNEDFAVSAEAAYLRHGVTGVTAPINSLIGVFDVGVAWHPLVLHHFRDGDGRTRSLDIPQGARHLYLGVMDGYGWYNNTGSYAVEYRFSPVPLAPDGQWKTSEGEMSIQSSRRKLNGHYNQDSGRLLMELQGQRSTGFWIEKDSDQRCSTPKNGSRHWGRAVFDFDACFRHFSGWWSYCGSQRHEKAWTGTKSDGPSAAQTGKIQSSAAVAQPAGGGSQVTIPVMGGSSRD